MGVQIDESRLPMVVVTYPAVVSLEQLRAMFDRYALLSRRHSRVAYIVDLSQLDVRKSSSDLRRALGEVFSEHQELLARVTVCEARIVSSALMRAALNAFDKITSQKWPCANFATKPEAEAWVARQLERSDAAARTSVAR